MADPGWVEMTHPDLGDDQEPAVVTEEAFEQVWKPRKWQRVAEAPAMARESRRAAGTEGDK
jgi:hypothetical protein